MKTVRIRRGLPDEAGILCDIWLRSVRATHHFLDESDIVFYQPMVAVALATLPVWVAGADVGPAGFMVLERNKIEALFVDPEYRGTGLGSSLIAHALTLAEPSGIPLLVDVNEDNSQAVGFYLSRGFVQIGRSALDGAGRPFPLLHMELREVKEYKDQ